MFKKISIIGLGYVGLPLAIEFGKYYNVIAFDIKKERISDLLAGKDITNEISNKQIKDTKNILYTSSESDMKDSDVFIVTVPTPIDKNHKPNLNSIKSASEIISRCMKKSSIIIYESTVSTSNPDKSTFDVTKSKFWNLVFFITPEIGIVPFKIP